MDPSLSSIRSSSLQIAWAAEFSSAAVAAAFSSPPRLLSLWLIFYLVFRFRAETFREKLGGPYFFSDAASATSAISFGLGDNTRDIAVTIDPNMDEDG